jgi:hypothetical protein
MYKIIYKANRESMKEARNWCDNAGISYATSYKDDIYDQRDIGYLPGSVQDKMDIACYFAFEHELDAATFCMMFGGRINYVSGQRHFV